MKILIAESNPEKLELYKKILEQDKHEILTADSRIKADLTLRSYNIDVVVYGLGSDLARLVELHDVCSVAISDSKEINYEALKETNFAIRKFNERNLENALRNAVKKVTELELAVA